MAHLSSKVDSSPAYFLWANRFDYAGSLQTLKEGLEKSSEKTWYEQEKASIGKFLICSLPTGTVRVFESHIVDIKITFPKDTTYENWIQAAVEPIKAALKGLGATNFQKDSGCY